MNIKICRKCGDPFPDTDQYFYRDAGVLASTCKRCRNARRAELKAIGHVVEPDEPILVFPRATRRCACCGCVMADLPELWGRHDQRICRICEEPAPMVIKVAHS